MRWRFSYIGRRVLAVIAFFRSSHGFSLVSVLVLIGLLSGIALALSLKTKSVLNISLYQRDILQAQLFADAGINRTIVAIGVKDDPFQLDLPLLVTTTRQMVLQGATVTIKIEPESGKLDINYAPLDHLGSALAVMGIDTVISLSILDKISRARTRRYLFQDVMEIVDSRKRLGLLSILLPRYLTAVRNAASFDPRAADRLILETIPGLAPNELEALYRFKAAASPESLNEVLGRQSERFAHSQPIYRIITEAILPSGIISRREAIVMVKSDGAGADVISWKTNLALIDSFTN